MRVWRGLARKGRWPLLALFALLLFGGVAPLALALDRELQLDQFQHRSWRAQEGAPASGWEIAQTRDGWLWLGGPAGLYRFDGQAFERVPLQAGAEPDGRTVSELQPGPDGELWVGLMNGEVAKLHQGRFKFYGAAQGLGSEPVFSLRIDADGVPWLATYTGLWRLQGEHWQRIDGQAAGWGLAMKQFSSLLFDAQGTLWIVHSRRVHHLLRGSRRFVSTEQAAPRDSTLEVYEGRVWLVDNQRLQRLPVVSTAAPLAGYRRQARSPRLIDSDGNLWSGYCAVGLCRWRLPRQPQADVIELGPPDEVRRAQEGLSGDVAMNVFEDALGQLWVTTRGGLDRFRRGRLVSAGLPSNALNLAVAPDPGGGVVVLAYTVQGPRMWRVDQRAEPLANVPPTEAGALRRDRQGRLWMTSHAGLWHQGPDGRWLPHPAPRPRQDVPMLLDEDSSGLWLVSSGVQRLQQGQWQRPEALARPGYQPSALAVDAAQNTWLAPGANRVDRLAPDGSLRSYGAADGLDLGQLHYLHAGRWLLAAGDSGVALLRGQRFERLRLADPELLIGVSGAIETADGSLWLNGRKGAVRLAAAQLQGWAPGTQQVLAHELLGPDEGHPGSATFTRPQPSALQGADGRLWFAGAGLVWLDPKPPLAATVGPTVEVLALEAGGSRKRLDAPIELAERTRALTLRYTAVSLSAPQKLRFRHRLDGLDTDWNEAGAQREAHYTNLGPGRYRFRVMAAHEDGVWSPLPAELAFTIRAAFYETAWFRALVVLAALALLWGLYVLRVRQLCARAQAILHERLGERERIARELHDTLLQGTVALQLQVHAVATRMPAQDPLRSGLERALARADDVLAEGRDRVMALRGPDDPSDALPQRLAQAAAELAGQAPGPQFSLVVEGRRRPLHPVVADEFASIGLEALRNAFAHAGAQRVGVRLVYGWRALQMHIDDDGAGLDAATLARGRAGHWGLAGMRERAAGIGARLVLSSTPGQGCRLALRLRARLAYR